MTYEFCYGEDETNYEAELDVDITEGRGATGPSLDGPGDPPEPAEIEIVVKAVWKTEGGKREIVAGADFDAIEAFLLEHREDEIAEQYSEGAGPDPDAENDARRERLEALDNLDE